MEFNANIFGFCFAMCIVFLVCFPIFIGSIIGLFSRICELEEQKDVLIKKTSLINLKVEHNLVDYSRFNSFVDKTNNRFNELDELLFNDYNEILDCQEKLDTLKITYNADFRLRNNQFERVYQDIRNVESKINKSKKKK